MKGLVIKTIRLLLFLALGAWCGRVSAQGDSLRVIPSDSVRYTIRIPDIIIYGEDVERQRGGAKLVGGEGIGIEYPQLGAFKPLAEINHLRLTRPSLNLKSLLNQVYGGYGRFDTYRFGGWRSQSVGDFDYHLRASYEESRGHTRDAGYWSLGVGAFGRYSLTNNIGLASNLNFGKKELGLYGFINNPKRKRDLQKVDVSFDLEGKGRYNWLASLGYQEAEVRDKGGSSQTQRERIWDVRLGGKAEYRRISLLSDIRVRSFRLKGREDLWEARVEGQSPLAGKGHLGAGLKVQFVDEKQRVSPIFNLSYIPRRGVGFSFLLSADLCPHRLRDSFSQNSYFFLSEDEYWEDVRVRASLGMEYEVKEGIFLKDVVVHQQIRDYLFWEGDSGLFRLGSYPELRTLENNLFITFNPYAGLKVELSLVLRDADLTKGSPSTWYIPYWERSSLYLALYFPLKWGVNCWLGGEYHGKRHTSSTSEESLSSYYLLNLKINKDLNDYFKVFFEAENLTNSKYEIWKGYREPGINGLLGVSFSW
jgi:hypothetical protein